MASNNVGFPSFLDTSSNSNNPVPRLAPSPITQQQQQQQINSNGNGANMNGMPMIAGQQMDVNFLYQKVVELSEVLKDNREKTQAIIASAEELAVSTPCKATKSPMPQIPFGILEQWGRYTSSQFYDHRHAPLPMGLPRRFKKQMLKSLVRATIPCSKQSFRAYWST